jgi:hypothetical protein
MLIILKEEGIRKHYLYPSSMRTTPFILLALFILLQKPAFAQAQFNGLTLVLSDSALKSDAERLDHFLAMHPMLKQGNDQDKVLVKARHASNRSNFFFLSLTLLMLYSLLRIVFPKYFSTLFMVFTNLSIAKRHLKEQLEGDNRASLWFYLIFFLSLGFIVFEFFSHYASFALHNNSFITYLICTAAVTILIALRSGLMRLIGWIFNLGEVVHLYLFNNKLVKEFLGLILFPMSTIILITDGKTRIFCLWIAFGLCVLMTGYSYFRNILILRNLLRISFVHFLLYLCAFEAIPLLILLKLVA